MSVREGQKQRKRERKKERERERERERKIGRNKEKVRKKEVRKEIRKRVYLPMNFTYRTLILIIMSFHGLPYIVFLTFVLIF